jgi:hypothetical protein
MKPYFFRVVLVTLLGITLHSTQVLAQGGMFATTSGNTRFSSETPLENVNAENKKSQAILNTANNELAIRMNMRDFVFPNKLMQEHFNENYIESEKYPTATFSGKVDKAPDYSKDGEYDVSATWKIYGSRGNQREDDQWQDEDRRWEDFHHLRFRGAANRS